MKRALFIALLWVCAFTVVTQAQILLGLKRSPSDPPIPSAPTISITTPTSASTYGTATDMLVVGGIAADNGLVASVACTNNGGMSQPASGTDTWSLTITLSLGANEIICTATDAGALTASDTLTVTYSETDVTAPTTTITSPADLFETGGATTTVTGTAADAVGVARVEVRVNGGAWSDASNTVSWTKTNVALALGANTIEARAYDAANNVDATPASITVTRVTDSGNPTVEITLNGGNGPGVAYTTSGTDVDLTGTCVDDQSCVRCRTFPVETLPLYVESNNYGYTSNAHNMSNSGGVWTSSNRKPGLGTKTYQMRCWDAAFNFGDDTIDITFTRNAVMMTQGAPPARTGTAYSYDFYADGADGNFTWDIGSDGVTTFADADCAGLSISTVDLGDGFKVGRVSGTPSGSGTCSLTMRANGTTDASTTVSLSIGAAALETPHAYYTTLAALPEAQVLNGGNAITFRNSSELDPYISLAYHDNLWEFSSDYVTHNHSLTYNSTVSGDQVKIPIGDQSGKLLVVYDMWWDETWRSYACRNGVINSWQGAHYNQKQSNFYGDSTVGSVNSQIYIETDTESGSNTANEACVRVGVQAERMNALVVTGQVNPSGTDAANPGVYVPAPCMASSFGQTTESTYTLYPRTWYRYIMQVEINVAHTEFDDWDTCIAPETLAAGTYHKYTAWIIDEWTGVVTRRLWAMPVNLVKSASIPGPFDIISEFVFELNTSATPGSIYGDTAQRIRNFVMLKDYDLPATPEDDTTVFKQPRR